MEVDRGELTNKSQQSKVNSKDIKKICFVSLIRLHVVLYVFSQNNLLLPLALLVYLFCFDMYELKRYSFSSSKFWNFEYGFRFFLIAIWPVQWSKIPAWDPACGKKNPEKQTKNLKKLTKTIQFGLLLTDPLCCDISSVWQLFSILLQISTLIVPDCGTERYLQPTGVGSYTSSKEDRAKKSDLSVYQLYTPFTREL